jgi:glycine/D-amino acid oxidase-like deaminating enzyme
MDLRSHYPYWLLRHGIINSYPSLDRNLKTDVAIIGAGISGALTAWHLCQTGLNVVIVDRRHAGWGSTAASTSLLQYEIDIPLHKLKDIVGEKNAEKSYLLCRDSIYKIQAICNKLKDPELFSLKPSFQFATNKKDATGLEKEYVLRKQLGFDLQLLNEKTIVGKFGFRKHAGLLSEDGAELDAYKFTHKLLENCIESGASVYDHTEITRIIHNKKNIELVTADQRRIRSRYLVIACGYESQRYVSRKIQTLHSTYVAASEPLPNNDFWYRNAIIWETSIPYLYLRTTSDNRIIVGGKDIDSSDPTKRDALLGAKTKSLESSFGKLFPSILFKTDFHWAGSFGTTKDGLPYIGSIPERPNTMFALGLGGNGITFSLIAAEIIKDLLNGKKNKNAEIFSFERTTA